MSQLTLQQAFDLALQHHRAGRLVEAEGLYRQILAAQPGHADSLHLAGVAAHQQGRCEEAVRLLQQAAALRPDVPAIRNHLGIAFVQLGRLENAAAEFRIAVRLMPTSLDYYSNLIDALTTLAWMDDAIAVYRELLRHHPNHVEAWNNLGNLLNQQGKCDEAIATFCHALAMQPQHAVILYNLGCVLVRVNRLDEAIDKYREAIRLNPAYTSACHNLGAALSKKGDLDGAEIAYRDVLRLEPGNMETRSNLAELFSKQGRVADAVAEFRKILEVRPNALAHGSLVYLLQFIPSQNEREMKNEKQRWNLQYGAGSCATAGLYRNQCDPERRLKIGYVSADFRTHVVGKNIWPLFKHHDHSQFEVVCYSGVEAEDAMTTELRALVVGWRNTLGMSDEKLAARIREDGIDILVDLAQHTAGNRLPVFARRPAPVQVSFAGYPDSTGLEAISCRISDGILEDADEAARRAGWLDKDSERVYLIDSFWNYASMEGKASVNELPAISAGRVTFGSLNSFAKINEEVLRLWSRILMNVPNSRLVMLSGFGKHRQTTLESLRAWGVTSDRVEFVERRSLEDYLENYHRIDIVLDPFPYGGHTTSLDALWMGVPVVSLSGQCAVSRAGLSQLSNLGLQELVAESEEEYVRIATELADNLPRLVELRKTLRSRMEASVLMDAPRFARQIEAAYRTMWREWCAKEAER